VNNLQETLLFPVRDAEARKQFLIACLVMLASFFIPLLPMILIVGYSMKVMRQVIDEHKAPSMPQWQGSDWSEMFLDGLRLYGVQLIFTIPLLLLMGVGMLSLLAGSLSITALSEESTRSLAPIGILFFVIGIALIMVFSLLSLPYGVILSAVAPHVAAKRSFAAGFELREWWPILRKGLGQFILAYAVSFAVSFVFIIIMQVAMITFVLMCIIPFIMIPYTVYLMLIGNALYAEAYTAGQSAMQTG
jgi:hypothetical protein